MHDFDAVVIGSGIGGLAAAVALARSGQRVAVFEQHYLPGGWAHSFDLDGYRFSPGVHYIGELGPGGATRTLFEGLGLGADLVFYAQNRDGYEHAHIGGERFDYPAGQQALVARLIDRFPAERAGIGAYFDTIARMYRETGEILPAHRMRSLLRPLAIPTLIRHAATRFDRFLARFVTDPRLRAILTIQAGDHCMPPHRCGAVIHTAVTSHYIDGGYFPKGGGRSIPLAMIKALHRHGGEIHVRSPVARILVEDHRAVGIQLADGTEIAATIVVSNADPGVTWGELVPPEHVPPPTKRRLTRTEWSPGAMSLFFAVDTDVRRLGVDSGNDWYSRTTDVGATYEYAHTGDPAGTSDLPGLYLGCSSMKDPTARHDGRHTFEAFSFVPTGFFERWAASARGHRPADYLAFKKAYERRMFDAIDRAVPGLRDRVVFSSLGTPLTNGYYVRATRGACYGTERRVRNIGPFGYPIQTAIEGLFQCGASTTCHGIYGASLSGVIAAAMALGCTRADLLDPHGTPLTVHPAEDVRVAASVG